MITVTRIVLVDQVIEMEQASSTALLKHFTGLYALLGVLLARPPVV